MSGPLPGILAPLTVPAAWAYGRIIRQRNRRFDRGVNVGRLDRPVISVGNITAGGVGKTPFVRRLARLLLDHGHHPVIAMRGYRSRPGEMSDEQAEHEEILGPVKIIADPDRLGALRRALPDMPEVDCVLLDDGFQHRRLHRDLDLVLIDAEAGTPNDQMLPAGFLREPLANLRRADAVIVTHATQHDEALAEAVTRHHGRPPLAWTHHVWTALRLVESEDAERTVAVDWLAGRKLLTMLGVGNRRAIDNCIRCAGASIAGDLPVRDHQHYTAGLIDRAKQRCRGCDGLLLTGKDWVKARHLIDSGDWPVPIIIPELAIEVIEGADELRDLVLKTAAHPSVP